MKLIYQKKAKLVGRIDKGLLWLLNIEDDWIHDQYGDSYIYYGEIHSSKDPFHPVSTSITGYFQDGESGKWIRVIKGVAEFDLHNLNSSWEDTIENLVSFKWVTGVYKKYRKSL
jgi:hypothetical protein